MNKTQAVAAVESGLYASRPEWGTYPNNAYILYLDGQIYKTNGTSQEVWSPTQDDENATDYFDGPDKPPHPAPAKRTKGK